MQVRPRLKACAPNSIRLDPEPMLLHWGCLTDMHMMDFEDGYIGNLQFTICGGREIVVASYDTVFNSQEAINKATGADPVTISEQFTAAHLAETFFTQAMSPDSFALLEHGNSGFSGHAVVQEAKTKLLLGICPARP